MPVGRRTAGFDMLRGGLGLGSDFPWPVANTGVANKVDDEVANGVSGVGEVREVRGVRGARDAWDVRGSRGVRETGEHCEDPEDPGDPGDPGDRAVALSRPPHLEQRRFCFP